MPQRQRIRKQTEFTPNGTVPISQRRMPKSAKRRGAFSRCARWTSEATGRPAAFLLAAGAVVLWAVTGPIFRYSEGWQLTINTGTTIITFLMVFLIQNAQNRESLALQLKLDELIRALDGARDDMIDVEDNEDEELKAVKARFQNLHERVASPESVVSRAEEN